MEAVYAKLEREGLRNEALIFRLLYFTGMRLNEACGLSLADLFEGTLEDHSFNKRLVENKIGYVGYLVIDSQPAHRRRLKNADGKVEKKLLKGRKRIDEKSARIIPIFDVVLWKELAERFNQVLGHYKDRLWGDDLQDYLLFDAIHSTSSVYLRQAYEGLSFTYKSAGYLAHRGDRRFRADALLVGA